MIRINYVVQKRKLNDRSLIDLTVHIQMITLAVIVILIFCKILIKYEAVIGTSTIMHMGKRCS